MLEVTNVWRIVALGSSKCRILRGLEAPGAPDSNGFLTALVLRVGPPNERCSRASSRFGDSDPSRVFGGLEKSLQAGKTLRASSEVWK